jgi:hypothetical protein
VFQAPLLNHELLIAVIFAVYWLVGSHEFLRYDDSVYITENPHVATGLTPISLTHITIWDLPLPKKR